MYNQSKFIESLSEAQRKLFKYENIDILKEMDIADPKREEERREDEEKKKKIRKTYALNFGALQKK